MSFLRLAERETEITQTMLLANIFSESTPDLPVPVIDPEPEVPVVNPTATGLIALPNNTTIQLPTNCVTHVYVNTTGIYITEGTIGSDQIQTNRIWTNSSAVTSTLDIHPWYQQGTSSTTGTSITQTTVSVYETTNGTFVYYNGNPHIPVYTTGRMIGGKSRLEKVKKPVKNSIKRALKLLDNFGMEKDTRIFLKGDEVEISHPDSLFKFVITKRKYNSIIERTERPGYSVPFSLELFTKTNIHIANLCVYAIDTPMLDQLMMVAMYVKTGNEEDLLREANFFSITQDKALKELIVSEVDYLEPKLLPRRKNSGTYINPNIGDVAITNGTLLAA